MKFVLATKEHDPELRQLALDEAMPGAVRLAYSREPNWFKGHDALGHFQQTFVGLDSDGSVGASGVRAIRKIFVNGTSCDVGYLCSMRSRPHVRRGLGLAQGYRFFKKLHDADRQASAYLTTILDDNASVQTLLAGGRAGLPVYHDFGGVKTYLWMKPSLTNNTQNSDPKIVPLRNRPRDEVFAFLQKEGAKKQFFPFIDEQSFASTQWRDFDQEDIWLAEQNGKIVGIAGLWDQRASRQIRVMGYLSTLARLRPVINTLSRVCARTSIPSLPPAGETLDVCHAAFVCIKKDDPHVFSALMRGLCDKALASGVVGVLVSLHERSPLNVAFGRRDRLFSCRSRLYCACWEDGESFVRSLDTTRVPHIEGGML